MKPPPPIHAVFATCCRTYGQVMTPSTVEVAPMPTVTLHCCDDALEIEAFDTCTEYPDAEAASPLNTLPDDSVKFWLACRFAAEPYVAKSEK